MSDSDRARGQPMDQSTLLAALRGRVARMEGRGRRDGASVSLGDGLPGLARACVHEILAEAPGSGAAFCAVVLGRTGGTVLWIATGQDGLQAWPPGLARCGLSPAQLIMVRAERWADALWAMEEALRCPAVTGALLAMDSEGASAARLDMTASRRLQLAAETGGALGLVLRPDAMEVENTAATSRWRVGPMVSAAGSDLSDPHWRLELLRMRGGRPGGPWAVTWHAAAETLVLDRDAADTGLREVG